MPRITDDSGHCSDVHAVEGAGINKTDAADTTVSGNAYVTDPGIRKDSADTTVSGNAYVTDQRGARHTGDDYNDDDDDYDGRAVDCRVFNAGRSRQTSAAATVR